MERHTSRWVVGVRHAGEGAVCCSPWNLLTLSHRANPDLIKKHGERKAFHTGSNTSCRQHARQHFDLYKSLCEKAGISTHHWAIPRPIWADMQAGRKKHKKQMTLDSVVQKRRGPKEFTREGLLHAVTQWVACDDQVCAFYQGAECSDSPFCWLLVAWCCRQGCFSKLSDRHETRDGTK